VTISDHGPLPDAHTGDLPDWMAGLAAATADLDPAIFRRMSPISTEQRREAAVLMLFGSGTNGPDVLLLRRADSLGSHPGQVAFPGGGADPEDGGPVGTALREAEEEVGIAPDRVAILGRLPEYRTSTGYAVTPVVGWAEPPLDYRPDPHEVEDVFEVPLAFLLDPGNHRYESAFYRGRMRKYWAMPYGERYIWGATAGMLVTFHRVLGGDCAPA
jgi:8-oxo-dGTP pyrophosphatase MutT (NUDIX family)